jgi:hypothetical protein
MLRRRWGGIGASTLDRRRELPEFPAPVQHSPRGKCWWHIDDIVRLEHFWRQTKHAADVSDNTNNVEYTKDTG